MKIVKTRNVKTPDRGTNLSAGIDFYIPVFEESFLKDLKEKNNVLDLFDKQNTNFYVDRSTIVLQPHSRILIPSGIYVNFNKKIFNVINFLLKPFKTRIGLDFCAHNKSGIATKKQLIVGAVCVDNDYAGEVHISLINTTSVTQVISENDKIVQFIHRLILYENIEIVDTLDKLYKTKTERGDQGFGHTDLKKGKQ